MAICRVLEQPTCPEPFTCTVLDGIFDDEPLGPHADFGLCME
jgi:hypothetical protein